MAEDQDQNIGFQDPDEEMPSEMKDYGLAAFRHAAGMGPHPGAYQGPPRQKRAEGEPTETDLERAREEGEISAKKMRAAQMGGSGELAPTQFEAQGQQQTGALDQQFALQSASQAAQAQAAATSPQPPPAPSGPAGVSIPFPAQKGLESSPGAGAGHPEEESE